MRYIFLKELLFVFCGIVASIKRRITTMIYYFLGIRVPKGKETRGGRTQKIELPS